MAFTRVQEVDPAEELIERVQVLQERLDTAPASATRETAEELVGALVGLYGEGLERIVGALADSGEAGRGLATRLAEDPLLATLLLIHDLHPVPLAERVQAGLESVRPYMESHGGNVELLGIEDGVARIHLRGSCSTCAASSVTLELAVKQALEETAPDLAGLEVEGMAEQLPEYQLPIVPGTPMPAGPVTATGTVLPIVGTGAP
jgi:Fe-S cluster biogenesis protein NfuA